MEAGRSPRLASARHRVRRLRGDVRLSRSEQSGRGVLVLGKRPLAHLLGHPRRFGSSRHRRVESKAASLELKSASQQQTEPAGACDRARRPRRSRASGARGCEARVKRFGCRASRSSETSASSNFGLVTQSSYTHSRFDSDHGMTHSPFSPRLSWWHILRQLNASSRGSKT